MKFGSSVLRGSLWLVLLSSCADAFHVRHSPSLVQKQMAQVFQPANHAVLSNDDNKHKQTSTSTTNPWIVPRTMSMVAGGAERAYGDDYYDGTQTHRCISR
jgi:hypothetical protein